MKHLNESAATWNWSSFISVLGQYKDVSSVMDAAARAWVALIASRYHEHWDQGTFQRIFGVAAVECRSDVNGLKLKSSEAAAYAVTELLKQMDLHKDAVVGPADRHPSGLERTLEEHARHLGLNYPTSW